MGGDRRSVTHHRDFNIISLRWVSPQGGRRRVITLHNILFPIATPPILRLLSYSCLNRYKVADGIRRKKVPPHNKKIKERESHLTPMNCEQLQAKWSEIVKLPIKDQYKVIKEFGFQVMLSFKKGDNSQDALKLYMSLLKKIIPFISSPGVYRACLIKVISKWYSLMTNDQPIKILQKKSGVVRLWTATIGIGDYNEMLNLSQAPYNITEIIHFINQARGFLFTTGCDGVFNIQFRLVDAPEPVLSKDEYKLVGDASPPLIIQVPSGRIVIRDGLCLDETNENSLIYLVEPGKYKVSAHCFTVRKKNEDHNFSSYYLVLCKTDETVNNDVKDIPYLHLS